MAGMKIILANPRGFCAGVDRAIDIVDRALGLFGAPLYVRHEIVHNRHVIERFKNRGVVFVAELNEVPDGAVVIYSAHGVATSVVAEGQRRNLHVIDATCPLVTKVHIEAARYARENTHILLIGHAGHAEVLGTMGQVKPENITLVQTVDDARHVSVPTPDNVAIITQTTLSVDDTQAIIATLKARFPTLHTPKKADICYATQNRQDAIKALAQVAEVVLVVGSANSSNANRLVEVARSLGTKAFLVDGPAHLTPAMTAGANTVGISAGASTPEDVVQQVVAALHPTTVETLTTAVEKMTFPLPRALRIQAKA